VIFGTVERDPVTMPHRSPYDITIVVSGPKQTVVARRKERVLGVWANVASRTFVDVPSYLLLAATRPLEQIANPDTLRKLQIGPDYMLLPQQIGPDIADVVRNDPFRVNFVRLKTEHDLYVQRPTGVTFLTPTLFRAEIPVPAEAPFGNYDADTKLFADGMLLARTSSAFEVVKVGFEQFVANSAREHGLLYGLTAGLMAIVTGWFASVVFRRD
jgi:uncharacterized protein (TIGR02186 family)